MKNTDSEPLDNLVLSYPCPVDWASMEGNDRERFCKQCSKTVFNISDLSTTEANKLLKENSNSGLCVQFYVRPDGTIKTDNCPKILRPIRETAKCFARFVSITFGIIFSISNMVPLLAKEKETNSPEISKKNSIFKNHCDIDVRMKLVFGQVCPTETRDACNLLLNLVPSNEIEKDLLDTLQNDMRKEVSIPIETVQRLSNHYKISNQVDRFFVSKLLEMNLLFDSRGSYYPTDEELNELEKAQVKATDVMTVRAEECFSDKNIQEAQDLAKYCLKLGQCGKYISYHRVRYPQNHNQWRLIFSENQFVTTVLMNESTLKRLLSLFVKIEHDSIFSKASIEKIEPWPPSKEESSAPVKVVKLDSEPPKPAFYKKELFDCPIVVIADSTKENFTEPGEGKLPLRNYCFEVTKILKAPQSFREELNKTKFLQGNYKVPFFNPVGPMIDHIRLFKGKEFILFIKDAKIRNAKPPFLHCDFGSTIFWTDELETNFEKWIAKEKSSHRRKN